MSEAVGPLTVLPRDGSFPGTSEVSPETQKLVDGEVRRIVTEAHDEVVALLRENRERLDALAQALLEHETLDEDDAYAAAGVPAPRQVDPLGGDRRSPPVAVAKGGGGVPPSSRAAASSTGGSSSDPGS
jgi:cell division protease FtsH